MLLRIGAVILLVGTAIILFAQEQWVVVANPSKTVFMLNQLPDGHLFEFWYGSQSATITKSRLIECIDMDAGENPDRACRINRAGRIANYPCIVRVK